MQNSTVSLNEDLLPKDYTLVQDLLELAIAIEDAESSKDKPRIAAGVRLYGTTRAEPVSIDALTAGMSRNQIIAKMAVDLNFLSRFLLPELSRYEWPWLLVAVWNLIVDCVAELQNKAGEANLGVAIPRGFAKTTFMKLYIVYCILFTRHTFILIVGSVDDNAENILKDVISILSSPQVRTVFGHWDAQKFNDRQDFKHFKFLGKDIILKAKGANTSLRGINVENRRPDIILMDDIQTEENAKSPVESQNLKTWIMSTLLPTVSPEGGINLFVGNSYSYEGAILPLLVKSPEWLTLVLGCILSDGTSLWPELHPVAKLLASYKRDSDMGLEAAWLAQYMNAVDINRANLIDLAKVGGMFAKRWPDLAASSDRCAESAQCKYIVIDPSTSKVNADDTAVGLFYAVDGIAVLRSVMAASYTPKQLIIKVLALARRESVPIVFVEGVAYQTTLVFWATEFTKSLGMEDTLRWVEVMPERSSKNSRILIMFAQCENGELYIHPDAWIPFKNEASNFDKLKTNNKDNVLDVAHYGPLVLIKHRRILEDLYHEAYYAALTMKSKQARMLNPAESPPC